MHPLLLHKHFLDKSKNRSVVRKMPPKKALQQKLYHATMSDHRRDLCLHEYLPRDIKEPSDKAEYITSLTIYYHAAGIHNSCDILHCGCVQ